jgi:hypothetical protein
VARGTGVTSLATVVLTGKEESVGPAVVETHGVAVGSAWTVRPYAFGLCSGCGGFVFFIGECFSGKAGRGSTEGAEAVFVGKVEGRLHVDDGVVAVSTHEGLE